MRFLQDLMRFNENFGYFMKLMKFSWSRYFAFVQLKCTLLTFAFAISDFKS